MPRGVARREGDVWHHAAPGGVAGAMGHTGGSMGQCAPPTNKGVPNLNQGPRSNAAP